MSDASQMKIFQSPDQRLAENKLYELVATEIERGQMSKGVWAKAIAESRGDEAGAKSIYIKLRVQELTDELAVALEIRKSEFSNDLERARMAKKAASAAQEAQAKEERRQKVLSESTKMRSAYKKMYASMDDDPQKDSLLVPLLSIKDSLLGPLLLGIFLVGLFLTIAAATG